MHRLVSLLLSEAFLHLLEHVCSLYTGFLVFLGDVGLPGLADLQLVQGVALARLLAGVVADAEALPWQLPPEASLLRLDASLRHWH